MMLHSRSHVERGNDTNGAQRAHTAFPRGAWERENLVEETFA